MAGVGGDSGGSAAVRAGRAFVEFFARDGAILKSLARLRQRFQQLGQFMARVGTATALGGGLAMKPLVERFVEFDDAIRAAGARTEATAEQFDRLKAAAQELGRTTSFSAVDVAKLMNELGTAGFNPDQVIAMSRAVLDLARATGTDAALSAKVMGEAIQGFGLRAEDATAIADKFTAAANKSAVTLETLGESFSYLAPVARTMGMSVDQALALTGALGNVGIQGSAAGTALRRIGILIASGDTDLHRIFGVSGQDAAGEVRPVIDVLADIQKSMEGLGNATKIEKLNEFFGLLGITSAAALGKSTASVRELEVAIANAGGTAAKTAAQMDAGLGGGFRRLRGAAEGVALAFGDVLATPLAVIAAALQIASAGTRQFITENEELAAQIGVAAIGLIAGGAALAAFGIAITAITTGIGALVGVVTGAVAILGSILGAVLAIATPLGLFIAAIVTLGYVFVQTSKILDIFEEAIDGLTETFGVAWDAIVADVKAGNFEHAFEVVAASVSVIWAQLMLTLRQAWNEFLRFVNKMFKDNPALGPVLGAAVGVMVGGPVGALVGLAAGAGIAATDWEAVLGADTKEAEARLRAAKDKLKGVAAEGGKPVGLLTAEQGLALEKARIEEHLGAPPPMPVLDYGQVKGGFSVSNARGQFGYGDTIEKKQLNTLLDIKDGKGKMPEEIGRQLLRAIQMG